MAFKKRMIHIFEGMTYWNLSLSTIINYTVQNLKLLSYQQFWLSKTHRRGIDLSSAIYKYGWNTSILMKNKPFLLEGQVRFPLIALSYFPKSVRSPFIFPKKLWRLFFMFFTQKFYEKEVFYRDFWKYFLLIIELKLSL